MPVPRPRRKRCSLAGQAVGIKEVDYSIWLVNFMEYDSGYIDLEGKLCSPRTPSGQKCNPCLRNVLSPMSPERTFEGMVGAIGFEFT